MNGGITTNMNPEIIYAIAGYVGVKNINPRRKGIKIIRHIIPEQVLNLIDRIESIIGRIVDIDHLYDIVNDKLFLYNFGFANNGDTRHDIELVDSITYNVFLNIVRYIKDNKNNSAFLDAVEKYLKQRLLKYIDMIVSNTDDFEDPHTLLNEVKKFVFTDFRVNNSMMGIEFDIEKGISRDIINIDDQYMESGFEFIDKILGGGWYKPSFVVIQASPKEGKSTMLGEITNRLLKKGKNVLLITLEISTKRYIRRLIANLLGIDVQDLSSLTNEQLAEELNKVKSNDFGKLFIYHMASPTIYDIKYKFDEITNSGNNIDAVVIDYMGLMMHGDNMYNAGKKLSIELRNFAFDNDVIVFTAIQSNRSSWVKNTETNAVGSFLTQRQIVYSAESSAIPQSVDVMLSMMRVYRYNIEQIQDALPKWMDINDIKIDVSKIMGVIKRQNSDVVILKLELNRDGGYIGDYEIFIAEPNTFRFIELKDVLYSEFGDNIYDDQSGSIDSITDLIDSIDSIDDF